jgi:predicted phage terminase large subunit-like protein
MAPSLTKQKSNYFRHLSNRSNTLILSDEAKKCRVDFIRFREYVCNHKSYEHHLQWEKILNTGDDNPNLKGIAGNDTLILAPRGSSKSTFLIEWASWIIGTHTVKGIGLKILYVSYEITTAQNKSEQVQSILLSEKYREVFPEVRQGHKWATKQWVIDRSHARLSTIDEPYTMACTGLRGTATGKRSHLILLDDLIKSPEDISTIEIRDKMRSNWNSSISKTRFRDGGRAICLGTLMRADDIYSTEFTANNKWERIIQKGIVIKDGVESSFCEEMAPLVILENERKLDLESFEFQIQNNIVRIKTQSIDPKWIIKSNLPDRMDKITVGIDLSSGTKERNDFTAMVVMGSRKDSEGINRYYVIDYWRGKIMGNIEKLDELIKLHEEWNYLNPVWEIWIEAHNYQRSMAGDFTTYVKGTKGIEDMVIVPLSNLGGDKLTRLRGQTGVMQNGLVTWNQWIDFGVVVDELINFGSSSHDDCVDGFVYALKGLRDRLPLDANNLDNPDRNRLTSA